MNIKTANNLKFSKAQHVQKFRNSDKNLSESNSRESDIGDKEFKSEVSVLKVSIGMSSLLKISGSEPIKSLPRPESGDPRES